MLTHSDWLRIQAYVESTVAQRGEYFTQGKVIKRDEANKLVWLKEFGDQPIPLVTFDFQVKYYIVDATNNTVPKTTSPFSKDVEVLVPRIGDVVLVARYLGTSRLPKCLGVIKSKNYVGKD